MLARDISDRIRMEGRLRDLQQRLMGLAAASASILGSPDIHDVLSATIDLARDVFEADGYALWRVDHDGSWRIVQSFGITDEFAHRVITRSTGRSAYPRVPFSQPLICEDVDAAPMLADLRDAYAREGIASMIVFPLMIRAERGGTMVFYSRRRREYPEVDVQVGTAASAWGWPSRSS